MKKEKKVWAITLIVLWWLAPNQIKALQQSQDSVRTLDEVVITATKFPKSQSETGKVLTIIDEQQLQRSAGKDLSQLLNEQVGLVINGANSNTGKDKSVYLRGAGSQYTVILIDGIPVNDPSGVGGAFDLRLLPIDQIERVEILKGSQSTLYGSDAIAGVINIITKKKTDKVVSGSGTLSYGTYNTFKGNIGIAGGMRKFDYSLAYTRFKTDGISEATDEAGNGNFDKDGFNQNSVQLNFGIQPIKKLSIRPFVRYTDFNGKYDAGSFTDDPVATYVSKLLNFGLTGQYTLSKGAVNFQYAHDKTERTFTDGYGKYDYNGKFDHAEVFINYDLTSHLQVLSGVNFQNLYMLDENAVLKNPSFTITSPYASFFVKNLNGFSAEVGGRFNHHSVFGNVFTYSINPSFFIQNQLKLFVNYSTGFKTPTLNELYGQYGANDQLKPQESKSTDAGLHFFSPNKKFDIRATAFSRKLDNVIYYGYEGYVNLNKQDDYGFEIEPTLTVNKKIFIKGFYAFVDGQVTTKTLVNTDTTFNNLLRRPKHSFGLNVGYQVTKNLFLSLNIKTFAKRLDIYFDMNTFSNSQVSLTSYQLVDLYAEYRLLNGKVKLFLDVKNILNQRYTEVYGYNTMRFNLNTGISVRL